jgi:predicted glycoside hydrolase/deacetylase ChbG (UPF0249 family)
MKKIRLIINADDFGLTKSVSDAIITAHRKGALSSTTLLAGAEYAGYAAGLANGCPGLSVGIHFQLVAGRPVTRDLSRIKTLVDENGMFPDNFISFFKKLHTGRINYGHIKIELLNQVKKALALGVKISHADSHQHLHMHPFVLGTVLEVMREAGICKLRNPVEVFNYKLHRPLKLSAGNIIKIIYMNPLYKKWYGRRLSSSNVLYPDIFFGQFFSGAMTLDKFLKFLAHARASIDAGYACGANGPVCEIMTHPGAADEYNKIDGCDAEFQKYLWHEEFLALTSAELTQKINEHKFTLCGYDSL